MKRGIEMRQLGKHKYDELNTLESESGEFTPPNDKKKKEEPRTVNVPLNIGGDMQRLGMLRQENTDAIADAGGSCNRLCEILINNCCTPLFNWCNNPNPRILFILSVFVCISSWWVWIMGESVHPGVGDTPQNGYTPYRWYDIVPGILITMSLMCFIGLNYKGSTEGEDDYVYRPGILGTPDQFSRNCRLIIIIVLCLSGLFLGIWMSMENWSKLIWDLNTKTIHVYNSTQVIIVTPDPFNTTAIVQAPMPFKSIALIAQCCGLSLSVILMLMSCVAAEPKPNDLA